MWFEERSWSNLKTSEIVEEWRDLWAFKVDFLIAACAAVFATTNLLNLPTLILENGGVAFVSAYAAVIFACALPIIILEVSVGQLTGRAPVLAFYTLGPVLKGIGISQVLLCIVVLASMTRYFAHLLVFLYYLVKMRIENRTDVPWLKCRGFPEFIPSGAACRDAGLLNNITVESDRRMDTLAKENSIAHFLNAIDPPSDAIQTFGNFNIPILIGHGAVWIGVFIFLCGGVRQLGKLIPVAFITSFGCFLALATRALTIDGLGEVLDVFWKATDWTKLEDYKVWVLAAEQALMACGVGFGVFITMGSYNKRNTNLVCDSIFIVIVHCILTVMLVGIVIGLVGFVSFKTGIQPAVLMVKGEHQLYHILAYFTHLPYPVLWSFLLLTASVCVLFNIFSLLSLCVLSTLEDALGERWTRCFPRFGLSIFVCCLLMACSMYLTTQAGRHAYELVTGSLRYITVWVILAAELIGVAFFYNSHQLGCKLKHMLSSACCWCLGHSLLYLTYILPAVPIGIAVINAMGYDFSRFSPAIHAWAYSEYAAWAIALVPILPIPLHFLGSLVYACCCRRHMESRKEKFDSVLKSRVRRFSSERSTLPPRYTANAANSGSGYFLLPQAPLAEPERFNEAR